VEDPAHRFINREPVRVFDRVPWGAVQFRELAIHTKASQSMAAGVWGHGSAVKGRLRKGGRGLVAVEKSCKDPIYMTEELSAAP